MTYKGLGSIIAKPADSRTRIFTQARKSLAAPKNQSGKAPVLYRRNCRKVAKRRAITKATSGMFTERFLGHRRLDAEYAEAIDQVEYRVSAIFQFFHILFPTTNIQTNYPCLLA